MLIKINTQLFGDVLEHRDREGRVSYVGDVNLYKVSEMT